MCLSFCKLLEALYCVSFLCTIQPDSKLSHDLSLSSLLRKRNIHVFEKHALCEFSQFCRLILDSTPSTFFQPQAGTRSK